MASGVYGTNLPSKVTTNDVDIFYAYYEDMSSSNAEGTLFTKLPSTILSNVLYDNSDDDSLDSVVEGMYNLKLPLQYFNRKGFYTIYIKPKEIPAVITDVSTLSAYPDVRGIVLDINNANEAIQDKLSLNNGLVGYRVIYIDDDGVRQDYFRLVTSNNKCEPIIQSSSNATNKSYSYRYNESSTLSFLTLTPSLAPSFKANANPFIGKPSQRIILVNTMFEPVMVNIEITDNDLDSISEYLTGSQLRDLDNGLVTTFNDNNQIIEQSEHYTLKDSATGQPIYEVKKKRDTNIDFSQTIEDKI